jgi:hypothetical protein
MKIHERKFHKAQTRSSNIVFECDTLCHTSLDEGEHCILAKTPGFTDFLVCAYTTVPCRDFAVQYCRMCYLLLSASLQWRVPGWSSPRKCDSQMFSRGKLKMMQLTAICWCHQFFLFFPFFFKNNLNSDRLCTKGASCLNCEIAVS